MSTKNEALKRYTWLDLKQWYQMFVGMENDTEKESSKVVEEFQNKH